MSSPPIFHTICNCIRKPTWNEGELFYDTKKIRSATAISGSKLYLHIIIDVCVGLPWNTFIINWKYTLFSLIERMIAVVLILLLVLVRKLRRGKGMIILKQITSAKGN
ncbi:hypothetical protein D3C81_1058070 [compost metagenome]